MLFFGIRNKSFGWGRTIRVTGSWHPLLLIGQDIPQWEGIHTKLTEYQLRERLRKMCFVCITSSFSLALGAIGGA